MYKIIKCKYLGPEESHSVHKLRTTKIVVEEASSSPEVCGSFTFTKSSKTSEVLSVEEVDSCSLNAPKIESYIDVHHKETSSSSVVEIKESKDDFQGTSSFSSRQMSIASVSEDENKDIDDLFDRIKKQRNALDDLMTKKAEAQSHVKEGTLSSK